MANGHWHLKYYLKITTQFLQQRACAIGLVHNSYQKYYIGIFTKILNFIICKQSKADLAQPAGRVYVQGEARLLQAPSNRAAPTRQVLAMGWAEAELPILQ